MAGGGEVRRTSGRWGTGHARPAGAAAQVEAAGGLGAAGAAVHGGGGAVPASSAAGSVGGREGELHGFKGKLAAFLAWAEELRRRPAT
jgi:hypothetical protein